MAGPSGSGAVVWLTGLSGAGKTTIATGVVSRLGALGIAATLLDGDRIRREAGRVGFTKPDRDSQVEVPRRLRPLWRSRPL